MKSTMKAKGEMKKNRFENFKFLSLILWGSAFLAVSASAQVRSRPVASQNLGGVPLIVVFKDNAKQSFAQSLNGMTQSLVQDTQLQSRFFKRFIVPTNAFRGQSLEETMRTIARDPNVKFVERDVQLDYDQAAPSDTLFDKQYALNNSGQTGGTAGADIRWLDAVKGLKVQTRAIVAVADVGTDIEHPDLKGNIYTNAKEIPGNGIDDDHNGFVDDVNGWDFYNNDNNPRPDAASDDHGTHTGGTIGAVTNNGAGVAGVDPVVQLMTLKITGSGSKPWVSALIAAIDYARENGAKAISVSFNTDQAGQAWFEAIQRAAKADMVYVNSAGNNGQNVDGLRGKYVRQTNNMILVAATDHKDQLASFSNFGQTVDIAAPGVDILSTLPGGKYGPMSGTSMACPHVAAAVGLLRSIYPTETAPQIIARLVKSADMVTALKGRIAGGRMNLFAAIKTASSQGASRMGNGNMQGRQGVRTGGRF